MANTKSYTNLPLIVNTAITEFAGNSCVLVKKITVAGSTKGDCHLNVAKQVEEKGGKIISGWRLNRSPVLINNNAWYWTFHGIWEDVEGNWFDITPDNNNKREFTTFVADAKRYADLVEGVSYNDCVIFSKASILSMATRVPAGKLVWTYSSMSGFAPIECDGTYRWLFAEYPHNYAHLKQDYGVEIVDGALVSCVGADGVLSTIAFDYSFSMA